MQQVQIPASVDQFRQDVLRGLRSTPKRIPCKYFYDAWGSKLFEEICHLPEYYLTRAELEIMERSVGEMSAWMGPQTRLIEFGSGNSVKTRILLDSLDQLAVYMPVDISRSHLGSVSSQLAVDYPGIEVVPLAADYLSAFTLPVASAPFRRTIAYFPGSTVGNMNDAEAESFLKKIGDLVGEDGALLMGMDLVKDPVILEAAYDDRAGVTAKFNLNLLERMRRQLGAQVVSANFSHFVLYNSTLERIEMYVRSNCQQTIIVGDHVFSVKKDELIHTENCHKYSPEKALGLAARGGFSVRKMWYDSNQYFSVQYWEAKPRKISTAGSFNG